MKNWILLLAVAGMCVAAAGCKSVQGSSVEEKRGNILELRDKALADLYREKPSARAEVEGAPGYAVFTNVGLNLLIVASGNGYGVATNNKTGKNTYMQMREFGVGVGMGAKDVRVVFVFHNDEAMRDFVESGWDFGGDTDAAAKAGEDGGDATDAQFSVQGMSIYQLTDTGLALQATLMGTKYWKDDELN